MTTAYPTAAEMAWFQAEAESGMVDTCEITVAGVGNRVFDKSTGTYTDPVRVVIYGPTVSPDFGKCRLQVASIANSAAAVVTAGDRSANVEGGELQLPFVGTGIIPVDSVVEMKSSPNDPSIVGRKFTISTRFDKTHAASRRLQVTEGTG